MEQENLPVGNQAVTTAEEKQVTLKQKDAVYLYTREALTNTVIEESTPLKNYVTKDVKKVVRQKLFDAIKAGAVRLQSQKTDSELRKYCSGLINNWIKKDPRFN